MIDKVLVTLGVMILVFLWGIYMPKREEEYVTSVDKVILDKVLHDRALQRALEAEEEDKDDNT